MKVRIETSALAVIQAVLGCTVAVVIKLTADDASARRQIRISSCGWEADALAICSVTTAGAEWQSDMLPDHEVTRRKEQPGIVETIDSSHANALALFPRLGKEPTGTFTQIFQARARRNTIPKYSFGTFLGEGKNSLV